MVWLHIDLAKERNFVFRCWMNSKLSTWHVEGSRRSTTTSERLLDKTVFRLSRVISLVGIIVVKKFLFFTKDELK